MEKNETLRLYGSDLYSTDASVQLTSNPVDCDGQLTDVYDVMPDSDGSAFVSINFNNINLKKVPLYLCYKTANGKPQHQGNSTWVTVTFIPKPPISILPLPLEVSDRQRGVL